MDTYLTALGWWNLVGSIFMLSLFIPSFGKKIFNESKIFIIEYKLDYWSKFWLGWAIGLNIFFALVNIYSVLWGYIEIKRFCVFFDLFAYTFFVGLAIWGLRAGKCGSGVYSVLLVFAVWLSWGVVVLVK